ncbi:DUF3299 domain-containing protein [Vibrio paucivorans]|uniref:DUF3299 domain-containing protein n=1 Tax=Vibrio paucivorans TaxID=2829489 RepID=A0A9X3HTQ6_9VIBR|nr:DUF3299 domain-containing protein [Vibrio paucivorans]MCW8335831.1 DUF3299 domain-containing protein [Vibrio paucivorans]
MRNYTKFILSFIVSAAMVTPAMADDATVTYWHELTPSMVTVEDPFAALDQNQMFDVATLARYQEAKQQEGFVESKQATKDIALIKARLADDGIDVEHLFKKREEIMQQREKLATLPNQDVLDANRKIPGFITPIEMDGTKVTKFFLVPTAGACIHTPPPPPNQLVMIDYPQGIELVTLATPVWVEGTLVAEGSVENVNYSDGAADVESVYSMNAEDVAFYQP